MKRNKIVWIIIAAAILIGAFITGREDHSIKVSVKKPVRGDITQSILTTGRVAASNQVTISSDVSGEITSLLVKEGDYVKKGDLIVKIKEETYLALVEKCRAEYNMTKERVNEELYRYELHRKNYERDSLLYDKDVITAEEFEKSRTEFYLAKSGLSGANFSVQSAEAALKDAQKQLEMTSIYSPISGTVIELSVSKGEKVVGTSQMAGTEIMKIADLETIEIAAAVNEMDIPLLRLRIHPVLAERPHRCGMGIHPCYAICGTGIPDSLRNVHYIFSHSCRTKKNQADPCQYVQLHTAYHSHRSQHNHRNGRSYLAESRSCRNGIRRTYHSKLQQERPISKISGTATLPVSICILQAIR